MAKRRRGSGQRNITPAAEDSEHTEIQIPGYEQAINSEQYCSEGTEIQYPGYQYATYVASESESEPRAANESESEPYAANKSESEPYAANESESEPYAANESKSGPYAANESESGPYAANESESEPRAANESESEPCTANKSESEPYAANESESEPYAANKSESEPYAANESELEPYAANKSESEPYAAPCATNRSESEPCAANKSESVRYAANESEFDLDHLNDTVASINEAISILDGICKTNPMLGRTISSLLCSFMTCGKFENADNTPEIIQIILKNDITEIIKKLRPYTKPSDSTKVQAVERVCNRLNHSCDSLAGAIHILKTDNFRSISIPGISRMLATIYFLVSLTRSTDQSVYVKAIRDYKRAFTVFPKDEELVQFLNAQADGWFRSCSSKPKIKSMNQEIKDLSTFYIFDLELIFGKIEEIMINFLRTSKAEFYIPVARICLNVIFAVSKSHFKGSLDCLETYISELKSCKAITNADIQGYEKILAKISDLRVSDTVCDYSLPSRVHWAVKYFSQPIIKKHGNVGRKDIFQWANTMMVDVKLLYLKKKSETKPAASVAVYIAIEESYKAFLTKRGSFHCIECEDLPLCALFIGFAVNKAFDLLVGHVSNVTAAVQTNKMGLSEENNDENEDSIY